MPDLNALQLHFQDDDFVVLPVASGRQGNETPEGFLERRNLTALKSFRDPDSMFLRTFGLETLPISFLIDRKGRMRGGVIGMAEWNSPEARMLVQSLLEE